MAPRSSRLLGIAAALAIGLPTVGACGDGGGAPADAAPDAEVPPPLAPLRMRRLLRRQYVNTVADLLGADVAEVANPPQDLAAHGFESIGAAELSLSDSAVAQYELSARAIAEIATGRGGPDLDQWVPCTPSSATDAACLQAFIESFGKRAWRRPLSPDEAQRYLAVAMAAAAEYGSFQKGVEYALSGILQSLNFLYQIEIGEPDPDDPGRLRLTGYEVATRISYFLLDTTPSQSLMEAAEAGGLHAPDDIRDVARDLLSQPGARAALDAFYDERFALRALATLPKDPAVFPEFSAELAGSMRQEAIELLNYIVWESDSDYRELLTARYAFVNGPLAAIYGVEPPVSPNAFEYRLLPDEQQRAGILGQAAFLAGNAHPALTSPTRRGRFVAERFLCLKIPPPPPDVVPELPADPGMPETMRDKLQRHMMDPACASCHSVMDPLGLVFEGFDGLGKYRTTDRGLPLDLTGEIADLGSFNGPVEMADVLVSSPDFHSCWVKNMYRHATGHVEVWGETATLDGLTERFAGEGYRVRELLVELVASEGFRFAAPPQEGQ